MNDMKVTVKGWVASDPVKNVSKNGISYVNFRVATTPRYKNSKGEWEDGKTEWITMSVFKEPFLSNIAESIKKGDPVIAVGSIYTNEYIKSDGAIAKNLELRLDTIGHDLLLGSAKFTRTKRVVDVEEEATNDDKVDNKVDDKVKVKEKKKKVA
jgi:single-strand DNA-binding protein